jgi:hypothetical protein
MTAATPAAGDSWKSRLPVRRPALPGCGVPCEPACSNCLPPSRARLSTSWPWLRRRRHQRHPVWVLATSSRQGRRRGARRPDRGDDRRPRHPRTPHRSPDEPIAGGAVADRAVGRRGVPCEGPRRDAGDPPPVHPSGTGDRRRPRADRCGRGDLPQKPTTGNTRTPGAWVEREVDATPARQPAPVALGSYLPHSSGKAARPSSMLAAETA